MLGRRYNPAAASPSPPHDAVPAQRRADRSPATTRAFVQWIRLAAPYIHVPRQDFRHRIRRRGRRRRDVSRYRSRPQSVAQPRRAHRRRPRVAAADRGDTAQQGIESRYAFGLRITDAETMDASSKRAARCAAVSRRCCLNPELAIARARIRVSSGNFITAKPMGGGRCGHAAYRRGTACRYRRRSAAPHDGDIVLISPLGYSPTGETLNLALEEVATRSLRPRSAQARFPDGDRRRRNGRRRPSPSSTRCRRAARRGEREARTRCPALSSACDPGLRQRCGARTLDQPPSRRRATPRIVHTRTAWVR